MNAAGVLVSQVPLETPGVGADQAPAAGVGADQAAAGVGADQEVAAGVGAVTGEVSCDRRSIMSVQ